MAAKRWNLKDATPEQEAVNSKVASNSTYPQAARN
jgi:hypothetical protein